VKAATIAKASAAALACALALPALAGVFSVTPVRINLAPRDRAAAVTITNDGDEELVMQADIFTWAQKPGGEDDLVLSEDLILSPPILKLAPRSRQVVRLARVRTVDTGKQQFYRLIVREVPEAKPAAKDVQLQVALAFSLPVFITPPKYNRAMECGARRTGTDVLAIECENTGDTFLQLRDVSLASMAGDKLASRETGFYILPGIKRTFDIKRPEGRLPGGKLKLAVTLDDGAIQSYDVTVPE
jgi:fimbrial chaperone protein